MSNASYEPTCSGSCPASSYNVGNYGSGSSDSGGIDDAYNMRGKNTKYEHASCSTSGIGSMNLNNL